MLFSNKKICLLLAGGTAISPRRIKETSVLKKEDVERWRAKLPELGIMARVDSVFISSQEAVEIKLEIWQRLAEEVLKRYSKFDSFIITMGADTLLYTAVALSFMVQNLGKPIILTGAQLGPPEPVEAEAGEVPFRDFGSLGIRGNLIDALQVAALGFPEVSMVFNHTLFSPVKTIKAGGFSPRIFDSLDPISLARVDFSLKLAEQVKMRPRRRGKPRLETRLSTRVRLIELYPTFDLETLIQNTEGQEGLVIKTYGEELLPRKFEEFLRKKARDLPIVIYNVSPYIIKAPASEFIFVNNMTLETTLIKLMWLLGQTKSPAKIRELVAKNYVGEIIEREEKEGGRKVKNLKFQEIKG